MVTDLTGEPRAVIFESWQGNTRSPIRLLDTQ